MSYRRSPVSSSGGGGGGQPADADLTALAGLDSSTAGAIASDGSGWIKKTYAQFKTALSLVKGDVGLGNVDNTADASKPISTLTQAALDLKQTLDSDLTTLAALTATTDNLIQSKAGAWASRTPAQFKTDLALAKGDVGLGNVDNTSDVNKPISTATLAALNAAATANITPSEYSLLGWSMDPLLATSTVAPAAGTLVFARVKLPVAGPITNVIIRITTATTPTNAYVAVYALDGTRLGVSADQAANWTTTGIKTVALASPTASQAAGTTVLVAALSVGTVTTFRAAPTAADLNMSLTAAQGFRFGTLASQTTMPSPITLSGTSASTQMAFFCVS